MQSKIIIPIKPTGKGRPKFARIGNFVRTYTPDATASAENLVKLIYQRDHAGVWFDGAFQLAVECIFERPKSHYNSKGLVKPTAPAQCTNKPDCDNCIKLVSDALNGIAYKDDCQCVLAICSKRWADYNERECMIATISDGGTNDS